MLTITDRTGAVALQIDEQRKTYMFSHDVLEAMIKRGIYIPPYLRPLFGDKAIIYPPNKQDLSATSSEYKEFEEAVLFLYEGELIKHGFKYLEKTKSKKT